MSAQNERANQDGKAASDKDVGQSGTRPEEMQNLNYEMLLLGLSLLSVLNIALLLIFRDPIVEGVLDIINVPLTIIFFIDFLLRLRSAESKSRYFFRQFGWADLAASLPFPAFKILRVFRIFRASRMIRHYGWKNLMRQLSEHRADAALAVITFAIMCVLEFGGIFVVLAERSNPNANIKTPSDAVWWAFVTITTVGYGDRYPTTNPGRLVGLLVMMTGVGLFGVLTGYLANAFLSPSKKKDEDEAVEKTQDTQQTQDIARDSQAMLVELKRLLAEQQKAQEELRALAAELRPQ